MNEIGVSAGVQLQSAFGTDPGRVRANNEDVALVDVHRGVYGVIDGVGGQAAGEIAASLACDVIRQRLARPLGTPAERVREAIAIANNEIFRRAAESPALHGMACVVTLAIVSDRTLTIGHVGDSRLYLLRGDGMQKLTHDHSPVGEREDAQEISEIDAMRHPRRNEVFRDVGSGYRDKDDEEFVEVIEVPFDGDCALLVCTDGLTDMLPSAAIERIVRHNAGQPDAVVDALVDAANDAGGKDNVTVVYAEGPGFAASCGSWNPSPAALDLLLPDGEREPAAAGARSAGRLPSTARLIVRSRATWFAIGTLAGVAAALAFGWFIGGLKVAGERTFLVDPTGATTFSRISDALRSARPGDVVRVEPGVYRERIDLPDGVDLIARVPGSVTVARPPDAVGEVVGISAPGDSSARLDGLRVESTPDLPLDIGVRIGGQGRTVEVLEVSGPMRAGIEVLAGGHLTAHGSRFEVTGQAMTFGERVQAAVTACVFVRHGAISDAPLHIAPSAEVLLRRNVFAGYGTDVFKSLSAEELRQLRANNVVIGSEPPAR